MKYFRYFFIPVLLFTIIQLNAQQVFQRSYTIPVPEIDNGGFGNVLAGVDLDGDGKMEIYAPNDNWNDTGEELIPRLYKYEYDGFEWVLVWETTMDIPLQNTWPALAVADLDKDGKQEIIWGPANYLDAATNPNPSRILVFETVGDGSDAMGVSDGFGGYLPNAQYKIVPTDNTELRPIKFIINDIDSDGTEEIIFADRKASGANYHYGVVSVSDIPDNGDGSETWILEASGLGDANLDGTEDKMDIAVLNGTIYLWEWYGSSNGRIFPIKYDGGNYTSLPPQKVEIEGVKLERGSFKSSQVLDIDGDGTSEIVYAEWVGDGNIVLLQQDADTLKGTVIGNFKSLGSTTLTGGDYGDIDGDGKVDFVFGTRTGASNPNMSICRLEYQGGDITLPTNYVESIIDSLIVAEGGQTDAIYVANLDDDAEDEVIYTGIPRSPAPVLPIAILDYAAPNYIPQNFTRQAVIPVPEIDNGGFGNVLAGVDLDGDGKMEIYAPNDNWNDTGEELIPRLYKYEYDGFEWVLVWETTMDIPLQNTWPALAVADLDKDGKQEIIWGPANYLDAATNPNPSRILVFETVGDGSDAMGVSDGFGGYLPNAQYKIVPTDNTELRPIKFIINDIDSDGTEEIIFADRKASGANYHYGVVSVSDIPDNGDGSETWILEASGLGDANLDGTEDKMDIAVLNGTIYLWEWYGSSNGRIFPIKYDGGNYTSLPPQKVEIEGVKLERGSFKSSQVLDIDGDGTSEIVYAEWVGNGKIILLQQIGDSLAGSVIGRFESLGSTTITGGDHGDIDGDGKVDFVFGTRTGASDPNVSILRLEYQGGDIAHPDNYITSVIDSKIVDEGGQIDAVDIADIDGNGTDEIVYTGIPRSPAPVIPIVILAIDGGSTSIEKYENIVPSNIALEQNYPNPFNPTTVIRFDLPSQMTVDLKIYNILGQEVVSLLSGELLSAGVYNYNFDASNLASGTYVYRLVAGDYAISKKMQLLK